MPTYIEKATISDIAIAGGQATRVLTPGADTASTFNVSIASGGANENYNWVTNQGQINSDAWESGGSFTVELRTSGGSNCRARVRVGRVNSDGTSLQLGAFTAFQTIGAGAATRTFSPAAPTWTSADEKCGNRLYVQIQFGERLSGGGGANCTVEVGTTNSEVVSTITENNGNCRIINVT